MAHVIKWQRGDGKFRFQPATGDDRLWEEPITGTFWSPDGKWTTEGFAPRQMRPKLYPSRRWALWTARREDKWRAKRRLTEVREVHRP